MTMDPYNTLGVNKDASDKEIKEAFKNLAKTHHPDRGGNEAKFKEINSAYDSIKTAEKRQEYDMAQRFGDGNFSFSTSGDPFDMADMFTSFFGQNIRPQRRRPTNKNVQIAMECTLEEVYTGTKKEVRIDQLGKTMAIDVPKGIDNGQSIRYKGLGMNNVPAAPPGDLLCKIYLKPHSRYKRQKLDLHVEETINCFDAMLGKTIDVQHLNGSVIKLKIPAGTQPNTVMRIPEHGMSNNTGSQGNLYIHVLVSIPNNLTDKDKDDTRNIGNTYS